MVNISTPPGLEGLFDLDRKGIDIRPTLLRVLTDQYLRSPVHSPDEERHYTELAMRLIDETDIATRAAVSVRLAPHACAPRPIILQLARDVLDVAEPVLLHSPCLTPADCEAIIQERGAIYAGILARRGKSQATPAPAPVAQITPAAPVAPVASVAPAAPIAPIIAPPEKAQPEPAPPITTSNDNKVDDRKVDDNKVEDNAIDNRQCDEAVVAEVVEDPNARELCELFFAAGSPERRLILLSLDFADWPAEEPVAPLQRADIWRMETAALRHHTSAVIRELERALGMSFQQARRIVDDELGEPVIVAAKAMNMPADVVQRIVLFMNPRVGQSVDRVYELSALYREISVDAARRLIAILRAAEPAGRKTRDTRAIYAAAETGRRALSELASTVSRKPDAIQRRAVGEE